MIELSHVTKTFGGATRALDELSLTVPQGAVYGLVGSNGAGKTTAIRHITGIFRQDSGSVTIGGLPVYENPAVKSRIGYIPDDLGVFGGGTLRELAAFYRTMYPRFDAKRYAALRDVFRLCLLYTSRRQSGYSRTSRSQRRPSGCRSPGIAPPHGGSKR